MRPEKENLPRHLIRCPKCNKPLADVRGHLAYVKNYAGETGIKISHDMGGSFEINCACGGKFIRIQKTLPMTYVIVDQNTAVDKPTIDSN